MSIIHDYKSEGGLDVFQIARIILSYEQDETNKAHINIVKGIRGMNECLAKFRKEFRL